MNLSVFAFIVAINVISLWAKYANSGDGTKTSVGKFQENKELTSHSHDSISSNQGMHKN